MKIEQLYFKRNEKAIEEMKEKGETKLPYFKVAMPPKKELNDATGEYEAVGEWIEVGAAWKAKNGTGYNFRVNKDVELTLDQLTSDGTKVPDFTQKKDEINFD